MDSLNEVDCCFMIRSWKRDTGCIGDGMFRFGLKKFTNNLHVPVIVVLVHRSCYHVRASETNQPRFATRGLRYCSPVQSQNATVAWHSYTHTVVLVLTTS